jgi:hypothetical protein
MIIVLLSAFSEQPSVPRLTEWENNYIKFAPFLAALLNPGSTYTDAKLDYIFFDAQYHALKANEYFGNTNYLALANNAQTIYHTYLTSVSFSAPGWRNFTDGFRKDFEVNGDLAAKADAIQLAISAQYATTLTSYSATLSASLAREVAQACMGYMNAEVLGEPENPRLQPLIEHIYGHFTQWFTSRSSEFVRPYYVALSAQALIQWYDKTQDTRVIPVLTTAADYLWDHLWLPTEKAFMYTDRQVGSGGTEAAPDYNLMICPFYAWLYYQTGNVRFRTRADEIFEGGLTVNDPVTGAHLSGTNLGNSLTGAGFDARKFNQCYRWSWEYVRLRGFYPLVASSIGGTGGGGLGGSQENPTGPTPPILFPIKNETWRQHFVNNGWTSPKAQVDAGYPIYVQPTPLNCQFATKFDLGVTIDAGSTVTAVYNPEIIDGEVTITPTISLSVDDVTYTDYVGASSVFAGSFRYVKISLYAEGATRRGLARIRELRLRVSIKEKRDEGVGTVSNAITGSVVTFNKTFVDVDSITVTAKYKPPVLGVPQVQPHPVYDFTDVANPTGFTVYLLNPQTGDFVTGDFSWAAKGT